MPSILRRHRYAHLFSSLLSAARAWVIAAIASPYSLRRRRVHAAADAAVVDACLTCFIISRLPVFNVACLQHVRFNFRSDAQYRWSYAFTIVYGLPDYPRRAYYTPKLDAAHYVISPSSDYHACFADITPLVSTPRLFTAHFIECRPLFLPPTSLPLYRSRPFAYHGCHYFISLPSPIPPPLFSEAARCLHH